MLRTQLVPTCATRMYVNTMGSSDCGARCVRRIGDRSWTCRTGNCSFTHEYHLHRDDNTENCLLKASTLFLNFYSLKHRTTRKVYWLCLSSSQSRTVYARVVSIRLGRLSQWSAQRPVACAWVPGTLSHHILQHCAWVRISPGRKKKGWQLSTAPIQKA